MTSAPPTQFSILIADDERASRDLLERALATSHRTVTVARDGEEALERLERDPFDLLVTDLAMPKIGGQELFQRAILLQPAIQVIFITGYGSLETVLGAINAGAFDFVAKPFKLAEIQLVVRNACDKVALMREVANLREGREGHETATVIPPDDALTHDQPPLRANPAGLGQYQRASEEGWIDADTRLALERLRADGGLTEKEVERLEERLRRPPGG